MFTFWDDSPDAKIWAPHKNEQIAQLFCFDERKVQKKGSGSSEKRSGNGS